MPARQRTTAHLTDAARMRVLAHPTRLALLGLLRDRGPQTAALLGEVVDEAPGTLSYHLGKLASAGLIAEADAQGSDGRERWWKAAHDSTELDPASLIGDPAALAEATALEHVFSQMWARSYDEFIDALPSLAPEWAAAAGAFDRLLRLDVDQAAALRDELTAVADRWQAVSDENRVRDESRGENDPDAGAAADTAAADAEPVMLLIQTYRRVRW